MLKAILKIAVALVACYALGSIARRVLSGGRPVQKLVPTTKEQTLLFVSRFNAKSNAKMVVEIMDFECPPCRQAYPSIRGWLLKHPDVGFETIHFPLTIHPNALPAAVTAEMARSKGKFRSAFDELYQGKTKLDGDSLAAYLDTIDPKLKSDMHEREVATARVKADMDFVKKMKIDATPTILGWDGYNLFRIASESGFDALIK